VSAERKERGSNSFRGRAFPVFHFNLSLRGGRQRGLCVL
jgi:hypothetical protein